MFVKSKDMNTNAQTIGLVQDIAKLNWDFAIDLQSHLITIEESIYKLLETADDDCHIQKLYQILACARSAKTMFDPNDFETLDNYLKKISK